MTIALDPDELFEHVLAEDEHLPAAEQRKWGFRLPIGRDRLLVHRYGKLDGATGCTEEALYETVRVSLRSVSKVIKDRKGKELPLRFLDNGHVDPAWLDRIPLDDVMELGVVVMRRMRLSLDDVKKSEPSPTGS